jgi:hypothetical protein
MTEVQVQNNGVKPAVKQKRSRNLPSLSLTSNASDMSDSTYTCKVDNSPSSWDALPINAVFSLSADGSYPKVKIHKSKACDLRTGDSIAVGGGRCYRVFF